MKRLVIGILAHVDAGKTTLSESMLYLSGRIRKLGRVDNQDAFLDTHELEKRRGITIFSKQAVFSVGETQITLLDTPGHVDFSAEMERTLQVLDYAILVISGADGVQGHTKTLWWLLERYQIPTFIFINKMDQPGTDKERLLLDLQKHLSEGCVDFSNEDLEHFFEQLALCDDAMLESYLAAGQVELIQIQKAIQKRQVFPCYFGSALKLHGVTEFMDGLVKYAVIPAYPADFGARVFKISRDEHGNRLTHLKLTGGTLKVKDLISNGVWEEKVDQIRIYSGEKYEIVTEIEAGAVCAVTGLSQTKPGEGLGREIGVVTPALEPVLSYRVVLPEGWDPKVVLPKLRQLEEETPELHIVWNEQLQEIQAQIMGEVQIEVLQSLIQSRFGIAVEFTAGSILYKETIANVVEGVGHFEPLGHYAEVHLLLEPGARGSGLQFGVACSEDVLAKSWQRLVLTHLAEKTHKGVLTGSPITDMKITLVAGRAHNVHTEGGDFREATYRAVRQGLKQAESVLLEPYYAFQLEIPEQVIGRAMTDIERMHGVCEISHINDGTALISGTCPVATMRNYQREVIAYSRGQGKLFCYVAGYQPCHNADEVIAQIGYDSESDIAEPTGSIFCANGAGFYVSWDQVKNYMHLESYLQQRPQVVEEPSVRRIPPRQPEDDDDEVAYDYYERAVNANKGKRVSWNRRKAKTGFNVELRAKSSDRSLGDRRGDQGRNRMDYQLKEEYLLVDGYNIIYAWPDLQELAKDNMDAARMKLLDLLCNYQGVKKCQIMVVFDAYRVPGHQEDISDYHNIKVVFTKEAQTADEFIERFAHQHQTDYRITVATSDNLQQIIIRSAGSALLSARDLWYELERVNEQIRDRQWGQARTSLEDTVDPAILQKMKGCEGLTPLRQKPRR